MANNELSGPIVSMCLIEHFKKKKLEKSLRFIFVPETIGALNFLEKNLDKLKKNLIGGFNLSCIGDERKYGCILTKKENSLPDHAILEAYKKLNLKFKKYSFLKKGSDERQYNSPGIDLPIVSIFRSKYGEYPEYHTSLDDFTVVTEKGIKGGFTVAKEAIEILLKKIVPKNKILGEPFMQKRKLYSNINVSKNINPKRDYMNFLQYADGTLDLNQVSKKIKLDLGSTKKVYLILKKNKLVE
jgi:aminopeptidase-like protein